MDEQLQDQLDERESLRVRNEDGLARLKREGVNIDPLVFFALRLDVIADMAFGEGDELGRVAYDVAYQRKLAEAIAAWRAGMARAKLTAGTNGQPMPPRG